LEKRLGNVFERAIKAAEGGEVPKCVSDVVAVVGVVGQAACKESVDNLMEQGKATWPHLYKMMELQRFVFFFLEAGVVQTVS